MMAMGKLRHKRYGVIACITTLVMMLGFGTAAFANGSPSYGYKTDSSHILISEADSSIADVAALLDGDEPYEVLGDSSLKGYSTLTVFSVSAIGDYDFAELEKTVVRGAAITSDMRLKIRFLPTDGEWEALSFTLSDDYLTIEFPSEGQLAIFAYDDITIDDENKSDGTETDKNDSENNTEENGGTGETSETSDNETDVVKDAGKAPQTGDALPFIMAVGSAALFGVVISYRKMHEK